MTWDLLLSLDGVIEAADHQLEASPPGGDLTYFPFGTETGKDAAVAGEDDDGWYDVADKAAYDFQLDMAYEEKARSEQDVRRAGARALRSILGDPRLRCLPWQEKRLLIRAAIAVHAWTYDDALVASDALGDRRAELLGRVLHQLALRYDSDQRAWLYRIGVDDPSTSPIVRPVRPRTPRVLGPVLALVAALLGPIEIPLQSPAWHREQRDRLAELFAAQPRTFAERAFVRRPVGPFAQLRAALARLFARAAATPIRDRANADHAPPPTRRLLASPRAPHAPPRAAAVPALAGDAARVAV